MRALLAAAGSRGDLQPMLALALTLRARGHEVRVCASPDGQRTFEERGIPFSPMGFHVQDYLVGNAAAARDNPAGTARAFLELVGSLVSDHLEVLTPHLSWAELFLGSGLVFAGPTFAELAGIPYRIALYCPALLPSPAHPPMMVPWQGLPRWLNRLLWGAQNAVLEAAGRRTLNPVRARLGLAPVRDFYRHVVAPGSVLMGTDEALAPAQRDFDPAVHQTGFWMLPEDRDAPLDGDLLAFLQSAPTVLVGFGSMPDTDPAATTALIAEGARRSKVQVLIQRGWAGLGEGDLPENCKVIGALPHGALFPRLAGALHHGGSGTTAAAGRAGLPQAAIPHLLDQFYWGQRIFEAGLGPPPVRRSRLSPDTLSEMLRALVSERSHREAAARLSEHLRARDGCALAADHLERALHGCP